MIVGGLGNRGVVSAASYEARALRRALGDADGAGPAGVPARGRSSRRAWRATPRRAARSWRSSESVTPLVEQLSIDEAFLDVARRAPAARHRRPRSRSSIRDAGPRRDRPHDLGRRRDDQVPRQARERPRQARRAARGRGRAPSSRSSRRCRSRGSGASGPATLRKLDRMGLRTIGDVAALDEAGARRARSATSLGRAPARARAQRRPARGRPGPRREVDRRRGDVRRPTCAPAPSASASSCALADRACDAAAARRARTRARSR